jgi:hypothetical protein
MPLITPPDDNAKLEVPISDIDLTVCCRAIYVTQLCFSGLRPSYIVHFSTGPKAYCKKCIEVIREIQSMGYKLEVTEIEGV